MDAPLILTLRLDDGTQARLQAERDAHFPPALNRVPAHVTLFHALPGAEEGAVLATLAPLCAAQPPAAVRVVGLFSLGRGCAYRLEAPAVATLRASLVRLWEPWLTPQDRQGWRAHATVQNKVPPEEARATLAALQARFAPWEARAEGLRLWRYLGGPWEEAADLPFLGPEPGPEPGLEPAAQGA